ncbi:MAG: DNA double-strand break repair nuclease NurA [Dehalococcoidia bacterium]|jgi:hypothetical protein|nr:DNA double-strand break repair nuclease NurA [Dehalococcoidia bacterium]MDP6228755.1 DNA double-strand break repair nuclease NurA [Dehalococcoidia bacterium]MDP7083797.1 DNA double-strand break repair nuclease NurA [Dehalococcoidia bacterium]MDP7201099.1 DNA double-strand break repair nuclease NurA [Dehalococcoidia bacterium]MDP7510684.1 DNA double-strand break repair nuclease NurA [Dehalococcoidia bacterium]
MPLDLGETLHQLDRVAQGLGQSREDREARLTALLEAAQGVDPAEAAEITRTSTDRPFLAAQVEDRLVGSYAPPPPPADWSVTAVDGSHIDVDRHLPVSCHLINLGGCVLTYGGRPDASFFSHPQLGAGPSELYLVDPGNPAQEEAVTGPLLGLVRTVRELEQLAEVVAECPSDTPVLALVDGSLVLWGLSGQGYRPFVREAIIRDRLIPALERLRHLAERRPVTLAAYVSLPRSTEVVNAIRCCLCPHDLGVCRQSCGNRRSVRSPCDLAGGVLDRDLFQRRLPPGWRSPIYRTNSSVPRENYGEAQQVYFYYLHGGEEIARVEVPRWVALDETLLSLGHSLILDQCRRGQGYPVAISEAHEQAVIGASDRRLFKETLTEVLERQGLPAYTSEKERSKRTPWV